MIPGKIFTIFAKFQGRVGVNDCRLPIWLQELLQLLLCFLRSFCLARIRLDPLGCQVLHHDCMSMIVSRFTTFTENFVICCNQITKIVCTSYDSANTYSARGPCNFGPLADLAISVFREVNINTVFSGGQDDKGDAGSEKKKRTEVPWIAKESSEVPLTSSGTAERQSDETANLQPTHWRRDIVQDS